MAKMTEKENFMRVVQGKEPAWLPRYSIIPDPYSSYPPAIAVYGPGFLSSHLSPKGGLDVWGVEYVTNRDTGFQAMPKPGEYLLSDITAWRDVIKAPNLSDIDWEAMAQKDLKDSGINREETATTYITHVGYFQLLISFMGFNEGLMAMIEEPDEVKELFEYLSDFYCAVSKKVVEFYRPDLFNITDDTATAKGPFMSLEMYRDLIKPYHARLAHIGINAGLPIEMHCCGRCEDFIEDWRDFKVQIWNPAQVVNDLRGIKEKYGNSLVLTGCWDSSGPAGWYDASEELVRQTVRDTIDTFAPGGGFVFWGSVYGDPDDVKVQNKKRWLTEEYEAYRCVPYA